jgi:hypothetical protein
MNKATLLGLVCWIGSLLLLLFQSVSSVMGEGEHWENLALVDLLPASAFEWIDTISTGFLYDAADYLVTMPLFILLFAIGIIFFIINAFMKV